MPEENKERGLGRAENEFLEGGAVEPLQDYQVAEKHRADTARYLAYALVGILALTIML